MLGENVMQETAEARGASAILSKANRKRREIVYECY